MILLNAQAKKVKLKKNPICALFKSLNVNDTCEMLTLEKEEKVEHKLLCIIK